MNNFPDYYTILGVSVDATPVVIKAAFKKLALQYHPDVYKGDDAHERMRVLLQAYQTLNDPAARKRYDMRRSEHVQDGHIYRSDTPASRNAGSTSVNGRGSVSPGARRDRQRHYDFPSFHAGRPVDIDLIDFAYTLTPADAQALMQQGLLRGVASGKDDYYCHRCHHHWPLAHIGKGDLPASCPQCRAGDWSEYLLLRCVHCCAVFESEQIRYEVGSINYGKGHPMDEAGLCPPYELFPLCPYCSTAHWCPAEEERVAQLRARAARPGSALRAVWSALRSSWRG